MSYHHHLRSCLTKLVRHAQYRIYSMALLLMVTDHIWFFVSGESTSTEGPIKVD